MTPPRRRGLTIAETLIGAMLLSLLLGVAYRVMLSGSRQQDFVTRYADLADQTRRAVRRLGKDVRSAIAITRIRREGTRLERMTLALPDPADPDGPPEFVEYEYRRDKGELTRDGVDLLQGELRDLELYAFDDAGNLLTDEGASNILGFLRLRFELGEADAPPGQRRRMDLTLTPRVPASQAKADRMMLERALERFGPSEETDPDAVAFPGTGRPWTPWGNP